MLFEESGKTSKKWASDDLLIFKHSENSWVISFRTRDILSKARCDEMVSIFSCLIECIDFPCGIVFDFSCIEQLNEDEAGNFMAVSLPFQDCGCQVCLCCLNVQVLELFESQNLEGRFHFAAEQEDALFALKFSSSSILELGSR